MQETGVEFLSVGLTHGDPPGLAWAHWGFPSLQVPRV